MASIRDYLPEERQRAAAHARALTEAHQAWEDVLVAFQPIGRQLFTEAVDNGIVPASGKHGPFIPLYWADSDDHCTMELTSEGLLSERHSLQELVDDLAGGRSLAFSLRSREASEPVIVVDPLNNFNLGTERAPVGDFIARYLANLVSKHGSTAVPRDILEMVALPEEFRAERIHRRCEELVSSYSPQGKRLYDEMINEGHPPIEYKGDGNLYYSVDHGRGRRHELREDGRLTANFDTGHPEKLSRTFFTFTPGDLEKSYPRDMHSQGIRDFFLSDYAVTYYRNLASVRAGQEGFRRSGNYATKADDRAEITSAKSRSLFGRMRTLLNGEWLDVS